LAGYFEGSVRRFTVPLVYRAARSSGGLGRAARHSVWAEAHLEQIALAVGKPGAARAVGRANGLNRMAILIPCHRLVNKNGHLAGYGGGLWRKQFLLDLEGSNV
jgi:AraC family transcriptional regulator of adaptative response/methylated-DNA-[protein]-cysteine methyltransferase